MSEENDCRYSLTQLLAILEQEEGKDHARFVKDSFVTYLEKQKRTAVNIAAASYGQALSQERAMARPDHDDEWHKTQAVKDGINGAQQFYQNFSAEWTRYCGQFWNQDKWDKDGLANFEWPIV